MNSDTDPLSAACSPDPYPYYASLRSHDSLVWNADHAFWIASRVCDVEAILHSPHCAVRPPAQPVPPSLSGGSAAQVFARLMRMNEGTAHSTPKHVFRQALNTLDFQPLSETIDRLSRRLAPDDLPMAGQVLTQFTHSLPVSAVASLLGFSNQQAMTAATLTADFVRCLSALSTPAQLHAAHLAALALQQNVARLTETGQSLFLTTLKAAAQDADWHDDAAMQANLIGLLSQTYEASAGLLGNCLVTLHNHPDWLARLRSDPSYLPVWIEEVLRYDPPVHNTRRYVVGDCHLGARDLHSGDTILLLLAAANRDPAANPHPDRFDPERLQPRLFTFGSGHHLCPGQQLAKSVCAKALLYLLSHSGLQWDALNWTYQRSQNGRIPLFTHCQEHS